MLDSVFLVIGYAVGIFGGLLGIGLLIWFVLDFWIMKLGKIKDIIECGKSHTKLKLMRKNQVKISGEQIKANRMEVVRRGIDRLKICNWDNYNLVLMSEIKSNENN